MLPDKAQDLDHASSAIGPKTHKFQNRPCPEDQVRQNPD